MICLPNQFLVRLSTSDSADPRASRRIYVSPDILKANKICVGDVLAIAGDPTGKVRSLSLLETSTDDYLILV